MEKFSLTPKWVVLFYALFLLLSFSIAHAESGKGPLIATGTFFNGSFNRPLLAQSLDAGLSWHYPAAIHHEPVPFYFRDGGLNKSSCNQAICIATGNYYNNETKPTPLLLQSNDLGKNWDYVSIQTLPPNFEQGWFNDSLCWSEGCIAVGIYENGQGPRPLMALHNSDGKWRYLDILTDSTLLNTFQEGWLKSISCSNKSCLAAGTYLDIHNIRHPLLMVSHDKGLNWKAATYKDEKKDFVGNPDAHLFAATCEGTYCIAVGESTDSQNLTTLLLMQSNDSGSTWFKPLITLPPNFISGWFNAVACQANFCIAAGTYSDGEINRPLLIYSGDKGSHWQDHNPDINSELKTFVDYGSYFSTTCNEDGCMAAGSFSNYITTYPLITVSHNKGQTWIYPSSARTSVPAAELGNGDFINLNCRQKICIATGTYTIDSVYYPLLALSRDSGMNWEFSPAINDPTILPPSFLNGHFIIGN
ncbi:MAG: exo-alpha-sialidase [Tatlockia sp.]|nr:exo-alpha-sialidase [Tatlockia sp.]